MTSGFESGAGGTSEALMGSPQMLDRASSEGHGTCDEGSSGGLVTRFAEWFGGGRDEIG